MKYQTRQLINSSTQTGFTIVELIITMAIGAIVLTQAVPSFYTTIQNSRLTTETNKLVADINLARSEAITRSVNLVVCSTANPNTASPSCSNTASWATGWVVLADDDGTAGASAGDTVIRIGLGQSSGSVTLNSAAAALTFTSDGLLTPAAAIAITICDERGISYGRQIQVNATGRPSLATTVAACS